MLFNAVHDLHGGRVFVLEIGAGAGEGGLPFLGRFQGDGWSGLLIEPHPGHFAALEALHADSDRVAVLNLGVSDINANLPLHSLTPEAQAQFRRVPRGRASILRDRIATEGIPDDAIAAVEVPFLRLDAVLEELGIDSAQVIAINAGGHEEQVLRSFALGPLAPALVLINAVAGTAADAAAIATLRAGGLQPYRLGEWLAGFAPGSLAVPLDELLSYFQKGVDGAGAADASETAGPGDPADPSEGEA
ncbi:MAG: hypothetical protein B7Z10_09290 [Rhodobacterales bacterium 32-66-7]|nr:MAG: hypothetical protein B7Z10_09290 [Rhodobacterales bacterium 32-66-7]